MTAKIHQCCCSLLHPYSIQFYPIWQVPSVLDIILVHWPTFSSGQDSLQDSFGVRLLHRQNTIIATVTKQQIERAIQLLTKFA